MKLFLHHETLLK